MLVQGDGRAYRFIVKALIEHECQFVLSWPQRKARVAFHKGTWRIMRDDGEYVDLTDSPGVLGGNCSLAQGFLAERLALGLKSARLEPIRQVPGEAVADLLMYWVGPLEDIVQIDVTQACRDGWFENFTD